MIAIDGSVGGGQMVRTALSLSALTLQPVRLSNIRTGRRKPGLTPQLLAAIEAIRDITDADVQGAARGSLQLEVTPKRLLIKPLEVSTETAGSCVLVLQTLLPPLMLSACASTLVIEGGTHCIDAPSFDFLKHSYLPLLTRFGACVNAELLRYGFYPVGRGRIATAVEPSRLVSVHLNERGNLRSARMRILATPENESLGQEVASCVRQALDNSMIEVRLVSVQAACAGLVVSYTLEYEGITDVDEYYPEVTGEPHSIANEVSEWLNRALTRSGAVGEHLSNQMLLPIALAGEGSFTTGAVSRHCRTNMAVIERFLPLQFTVEHVGETLWRVRL